MASGNSNKSLVCFLFCGLLASAAYSHAQSADDRSAELSRARASMKSGEFNGYFAEVIGENRVIDAVPDLERQFLRVTDPLDKAKIAQVLLYLGDKKEIYWDYLSELAKPALDSNAPDPALYDSAGKHIPGLSSEFTAWAQAHGQSPDQAGENAVYVLPGIIGLVGKTADARAIPLLRRALASRNPMVQLAAASGLAEMRDVPSIPTMIAKCKAAHPEIARMMAESLVYFDDQEAQSAVDTFVPRQRAKELREARVAGQGALHRR